MANFGEREEGSQGLAEQDWPYEMVCSESGRGCRAASRYRGQGIDESAERGGFRLMVSFCGAYTSMS